MYIHLGRDYVLNDRDIIGIFNMETTTITPRGREFLNYAQKNGAVVSLSDELPQSYVLADGAVVDTVYLSELSLPPCAAEPKRWWSEICGKRAENPQKKRDGKAPELPGKPHRASRNALCGRGVKTQQNCEKKGHPGVPVPALLSFEKTNAKTNKREKGNGRRNHYQHKCRNRYRP